MNQQKNDITINDLKKMNIKQLREVMDQGHAIVVGDLNNKMFKGYSLGSPDLLFKATWYTFRKCFHYDESMGVTRGWNVRMEQNGGYDDLRIPKRKSGKQWSFGHYTVNDASTLPSKNVYKGWNQGVVLDYRNIGNPFPEWLAYTPLVAVNVGSSKLLLGWEVFKIGSFLLPISNAWAIEYEGELDIVEPLPIKK